MRNMQMILCCLVLLTLSNCARNLFPISNYKENVDCYNKHTPVSSMILCLNLKDSNFVYIVQRSLMSPVACGKIITYNDSLLNLRLDKQETERYISKNMNQDYILFPHFETLRFSGNSNYVKVEVKPMVAKGDTSIIENYLHKQ